MVMSIITIIFKSSIIEYQERKQLITFQNRVIEFGEENLGRELFYFGGDG